MEVKRKLYKKIGMQNFHYFSSSPHKLLNPLDSKGNYSPTSYNNEVGTLAIDWWAVTFGTARRGLGGLQYAPAEDILLIFPLSKLKIYHHILNGDKRS